VLRAVIASEAVQNALIFCNRKRDVDVLATSLRRHGFKAAGLHGDMAQAQRTATLQSFRDGEINLLVATDVAGRGIDIRGLSHVFNFDVPFHAEDYIHRIGRTGRAGQSGRAITLVTSDDGKFLDAIQHLIKKPIALLTAPVITDPTPATDYAVPETASEASVPAPEASSTEAPVEAPRAARGRPPHDNRRDHRVDNRRPSRPRTPEKTHEPETTSVAVEASPEPTRAPAPREARPSHQRDNRDGNDRKVVGLGDHVPAFLQKPVPFPRTGTE
jgi:superfamily II DNA/RNA helicase